MMFTVAMLQIAPHGLDQGRNLEKGIQYCRKAKTLGADLALFPELWNIGFTMCPFDDGGRQAWEESAIDQRSGFFQSFLGLARELNINIALSYLEKHTPKPKNTVSIIDRHGQVILNYSKVFICNFGMEKLAVGTPKYQDVGCDFNCSAGDSFDVCTLRSPDGKITVGAMICADREFPEAATQLMLKGAELFVVSNACSWDETRTALLKARSFENLVGIAMTNYPMPLCNGNSQAHSCVAWKNGAPVDTLIVRAGEDEQIVLARIDLAEIREFRKVEAWRKEYRHKWNS